MTNAPHDPKNATQGGQTPVSRPTPGTVASARPNPAALAKNKPAVTKQAAPAAGVKIPHNDPAKWGRVEADGSAYVSTSTGERHIGDYKAGSPEEGLAHFGARFDDVSTEIALLETRLTTHPEEARRIRSDAGKIREDLDSAAIIGDIESLHRRLATIATLSVEVESKEAAEKEHRRTVATERKEALATEAEKLAAHSTDWKQAGDRLREIVDEWKTIKGVDRTIDDQLWKRYAAARDSFRKRRGAHFAELDRNRVAVKSVKEDLIARAEALQDSTDWAETSRAYRDLMKEWKAAGRAHRDVDDKLWERFRTAQDKFFEARKANDAKRDEEFEANAVAKQQLLDEYDTKISPADHGLDKARQALHELQEKWEEIGYVPRGRVREFEDKIATVEKRVSDAADAEWRRTDPEAQAKIAQFQAKADQFAKEAEAFEAKGNEKKAAALREQAAQWQQWADTAAAAIEN
ncbi:hypothetical protein CRES_1202 [Corynebacterium resistens DSM 45100]|uniref:DNA repair ATPase n=1 Tax=Corynebacterium resistens (strain DSM 45100 / JCM 12819 / GTC 2026 / SICGH 158) TaxID=662755 RepID=F8DXZ9_CORRG|nr:DUF349 domain-containing protein [Corynebacterium resistens]AEI09557.1 hypothetical protein CRES_1202 [Corynebacterium resistens DSM 45100]